MMSPDIEEIILSIIKLKKQLGIQEKVYLYSLIDYKSNLFRAKNVISSSSTRFLDEFGTLPMYSVYEFGLCDDFTSLSNLRYKTDNPYLKIFSI